MEDEKTRSKWGIVPLSIQYYKQGNVSIEEGKVVIGANYEIVDKFNVILNKKLGEILSKIAARRIESLIRNHIKRRDQLKEIYVNEVSVGKIPVKRTFSVIYRNDGLLINMLTRLTRGVDLDTIKRDIESRNILEEIISNKKLIFSKNISLILEINKENLLNWAESKLETNAIREAMRKSLDISLGENNPFKVYIEREPSAEYYIILEALLVRGRKKSPDYVVKKILKIQGDEERELVSIDSLVNRLYEDPVERLIVKNKLLKLLKPLLDSIPEKYPINTRRIIKNFLEDNLRFGDLKEQYDKLKETLRNYEWAFEYLKNSFEVKLESLLLTSTPIPVNTPNLSTDVDLVGIYTNIPHLELKNNLILLSYIRGKTISFNKSKILLSTIEEAEEVNIQDSEIVGLTIRNSGKVMLKGVKNKINEVTHLSQVLKIESSNEVYIEDTDISIFDLYNYVKNNKKVKLNSKSIPEIFKIIFGDELEGKTTKNLFSNLEALLIIAFDEIMNGNIKYINVMREYSQSSIHSIEEIQNSKLGKIDLAKMYSFEELLMLYLALTVPIEEIKLPEKYMKGTLPKILEDLIEILEIGDILKFDLEIRDWYDEERMLPYISGLIMNFIYYSHAADKLKHFNPRIYEIYKSLEKSIYEKVSLEKIKRNMLSLYSELFNTLGDIYDEMEKLRKLNYYITLLEDLLGINLENYRKIEVVSEIMKQLVSEYDEFKKEFKSSSRPQIKYQAKNVVLLKILYSMKKKLEEQ